MRTRRYQDQEGDRGRGFADAHLRVQTELLKFEVFRPGGIDLAVRAAENFRALRKKGFTIRRIADCWIATFCLREGHELLHRDRDFEPFDRELGLRVVRARNASILTN